MKQLIIVLSLLINLNSLGQQTYETINIDNEYRTYYKYLPTNFNAFEGLFDAFDVASEEEDEAFDFDTADYLPIGFNAHLNIYDTIEEIAIVEEDEPFDFDTMAYLPKDFDAYDTRLALSTTYYLNCITFPSI